MGTDKALLQLNGTTLVEKAVETCRPVCSSIVISSDNPTHHVSGTKIINDKIKNCGPIGGIYSCLIQSETLWNFVISVDAAFVETVFIQHLINESGNFEAIVPVHKRRKEPLIAIYHLNCLNTMKKMLDSGNYRMQSFLNGINTKYIDCQLWIDKFPKIFKNLNQPGDL